MKELLIGTLMSREVMTMLMIRIMVYILVVSAILIFFMGASGGDVP